MNLLPIILLYLFLYSLLMSYLASKTTKSAIDIAKGMGIGYNLGNLFDCFNISKEIINPEEQITLCGNGIPTRDMIIRIKKYGFKTIRFPVTWLHFIDENGNINLNWMARVKEVVDWIINSNLYCILNIQNDGAIGNWLREGLIMKNRFINLWNQIANEFKYYDEHLIFESMRDIEAIDGEDNTLYLQMLYEFTQIFVDTIRNGEGYNKNRLLIVPGIKMDIDYTCSSDYLMPKDPSNKLGISIIFYYPYGLVIAEDGKPYTFKLGNETLIGYPTTTWGSDSDYIELISNFEQMNKAFVAKKIPVILSECTVITQQKKEIASIREYLYATFSLSLDYKAIIPCLWDTSTNITGNFNYYNRDNNLWYDEKIKNNFLKISRHKNIKPIDYYYMANQQTITTPLLDGNFYFRIEKKEVLTIYFNAEIPSYLIPDLYMQLVSNDQNSQFIYFEIVGKDAKKQFDGTYSFTIDVKNKGCKDTIYLSKETDEVKINYLTVEFKENFLTFNYTGYKLAILDSIS